MDTQAYTNPKAKKSLVLPGPTSTRSGKKYGINVPSESGTKKKEVEGILFVPPCTAVRKRKVITRPEPAESTKTVVRRQYKKRTVTKKEEEEEEEEEEEKFVSE
jgi:hypothetical protein